MKGQEPAVSEHEVRRGSKRLGRKKETVEAEEAGADSTLEFQ
jgi:hypothetical protein